ncbi:MAG TPA: ice-binding family protein, partial [bacterium]
MKKFFENKIWFFVLFLAAIHALYLTGCSNNSPVGAKGMYGAGLGPGPVALGEAGNYVILAKTGVDTVPTSNVKGNIGLSPIDRTALTGFSEAMDSSNVFSTSAQVTGKLYAADYTNPTPSNLTTAISNMETAYTTAAGLPAKVTELGAGNIGGLTLAPGVYKWGTGLTIPTDVTLAGGP